MLRAHSAIFAERSVSRKVFLYRRLAAKRLLSRRSGRHTRRRLPEVRGSMTTERAEATDAPLRSVVFGVEDSAKTISRKAAKPQNKHAKNSLVGGADLGTFSCHRIRDNAMNENFCLRILVFAVLRENLEFRVSYMVAVRDVATEEATATSSWHPLGAETSPYIDSGSCPPGSLNTKHNSPKWVVDVFFSGTQWHFLGTIPPGLCSARLAVLSLETKLAGALSRRKRKVMGNGQVPQAKVVIPGTCGRESVPDFADETAKTEWSTLSSCTAEY